MLLARWEAREPDGADLEETDEWVWWEKERLELEKEMRMLIQMASVNQI